MKTPHDHLGEVCRILAFIVIGIFAFTLVWNVFYDDISSMNDKAAVVLAAVIGFGGLVFAALFNGYLGRRRKAVADADLALHHISVLQSEFTRSFSALNAAYNLLSEEDIDWRKIEFALGRVRFSGVANPEFFRGLKPELVASTYAFDQRLRAMEWVNDNFESTISEEYLDNFEYPDRFEVVEEMKIKSVKYALGEFMNDLIAAAEITNEYTELGAQTMKIPKKLREKYAVFSRSNSDV